MSKLITRKILFVSHLGRLEGGADRVLAMTVDHLDISNIDPLVLLPRNDTLAQHFESKETSLIVTRYRGWISQTNHILGKLYRAATNTVAVLHLIQKLRDKNIALVYTNSLYSPIGCLLAYSLRVPHICHIHEDIEGTIRSHYDFGTRRSISFLDRYSKGIICVSQSVLKPVAPYINPENVHVIYNPVPNLDAFKAIEKLPRSNVTLGFVGNLKPHKRPEDAIHTLYNVREKGVDARLLVAGQGDRAYVQQLKALADKLNVTKHIEWLGYVTDMVNVYEQIDIYIACSYGEGFSLAVIEAMASACAVVATRQGGSSEVVKHSENGLLFDATDVQTLTNHVMSLTTDRKLLRTMQQTARETVVDVYTMDNYITQITDVIETVLEGHI